MRRLASRTVAGTGPTIHVAGTNDSRTPLTQYVALLGMLMLLAALSSTSTALTGRRLSTRRLVPSRVSKRSQH